MKALTKEQERQLARLEDRVDKASAGEIDSGYAIREIRSTGFWLGKARTFRVYCEMRFGLKYTTVATRVRATYIIDTLREDVDIRRFPMNVTQAIALGQGLGPQTGFARNPFSEEDGERIRSDWKQITTNNPRTITFRIIDVFVREGRACRGLSRHRTRGSETYFYRGLTNQEVAERFVTLYGDRLSAIMGEICRLQSHGVVAA